MNQERINDRAKLIHHRLIARRLGGDPLLVAQARETLGQWRRARAHALWMDEWASMLSLPIAVLRRELTRRMEKADQLRVTSPFAVIRGASITELGLRRRLWQVAKRGMTERSTILSALSGH
jgi:hypothetical protein